MLEETERFAAKGNSKETLRAAVWDLCIGNLAGLMETIVGTKSWMIIFTGRNTGKFPTSWQQVSPGVLHGPRGLSFSRTDVPNFRHTCCETFGICQRERYSFHRRVAAV